MQLKLPELGEGVHEGELVKWSVKVGDTVKDDQPICEIMTDKATVELPSPFSGKITSLNSKEGQVVKVGEAILDYEPAGGAKASADTKASAGANGHSAPGTGNGHSAPAPMSAAPKAPAAAMASAPQTHSPGVSLGGPVTAAPSTRKFAREAGIDITGISGTGPAGRVMREDVERASTGGAGATSAGVARPSAALRGYTPGAMSEERVPFKGLRKKIAEKMRLSKDKAAHFTYVEECDATELVALRTQAKPMAEAAGIKLTYLPFVMKAMVAALRDFPTLNSTLDESTNEIVIKHYFNIGLSVQTDDGLSAPVIKDVGSKSVLQIAKDIQDVVARARSKKLTMEDLTGSTITLTNAGSIGGLFATPVINFPEVAILGFNKISRKPVAKMIDGKEQIVIRDWTYFSISLDHRIIDGAVGAEFMKRFIQYIENPALLALA